MTKDFDSPYKNIIVVGASAGGVEALMKLVSHFPARLPAAVFIVLHLSAEAPSLLPSILSRVSLLPTSNPADGTPIEAGQIYVAPPDYHLLVEPGKIRIIHGPKENRHRPALDPLFRSAAHAYGPRVVGVVLTGALDDGTAGLLAIKRRNGTAIVQDPQEALYSSMPQNALAHVQVDYSLPLNEIGPLLVRLGGETANVDNTEQTPHDMQMETKMTEFDLKTLHQEPKPGIPSSFSCPECGGVLWELREEALTRFRCRVGHAFSVDTVLAEQSDAIEKAMWVALKTLEENVSLTNRLTRQAEERGQTWLKHRYEVRLRDNMHNAALLREVLLKNQALSQTEPK